MAVPGAAGELGEPDRAQAVSALGETELVRLHHGDGILIQDVYAVEFAEGEHHLGQFRQGSGIDVKPADGVAVVGFRISLVVEGALFIGRYGNRHLSLRIQQVGGACSRGQEFRRIGRGDAQRFKHCP